MIKDNNKLISIKFYKYLIPGMLIAFLLRFTSVIDGVIVGNSLGSVALTSTGLSLSALYISQLPGYALGVGAAIACSNLIGKSDYDKASKVHSVSLIAVIITCLIFSALSYPLSYPIARFISNGQDEYIDYMRTYIFIYWLTAPIIGILLYFSSIFAIDNHPFLSTAMVLVSSAFKIIFMVVCLFLIKIDDNMIKMHLAALSTAFGAFISFFIIIIYKKSSKRLLKFNFKIQKSFSYLKISLKSGTASILTYLLMALQLLVINSVIARALNDDEILIYGVISNMLFCIELFTAGIIQLIPALIGVLYGEEDYSSVLNLSKKMLIICETISILIVAIFIIYPKLLMVMFGYDTNISLNLLNMGYNNIRIFSLMFIFNQINMFIITYYPTVGKSSVASLTVVLRTIVLSFMFSIPLAYKYHLYGYSISNIIIESLTLLITLGYILFLKIKNKNYYSIFLIERPKSLCELNLTLDLNCVELLYEKIKEYLKEHNYLKYESVIIEKSHYIIDLIIKDGYQNNLNRYIDYNLKFNKDNIVIRIRDDGKKININDNDIKYQRIINLNNSLIKINY